MTTFSPRSIVFDLDGTLLDGYRAITMSLEYAMTSLGVPPWDAATVRRQVGRGLEVLLADAVGSDRALEGVRLFRERYPEVFLEHSSLLPEVGETVRLLAERGMPMGVASNKPSRFSSELLRHFGLAEALPFCWGPDRVARPKPDPEMVFRLLEELGTSAEEALYVGDMPVDIDSARAAGVTVWVIASGSSTREELEAAAPDRILDRFSDLSRLLTAPPPRSAPAPSSR